MASTGRCHRRARTFALAAAVMAFGGVVCAARTAESAPARPRRRSPPAPPPAAARPPVVAPPPAPPADESADAPELVWRQILMAPRITGNLRAVAVDPSDRKNIYVGTEEGTLVHTRDGGVSWQEIELSPFLLESPTAALYVSPWVIDPYKAIDVFAGFHRSSPLAGGVEYDDYNPLNRPSATQLPPNAAPSLERLQAGIGPLFVLPIRLSAATEPLLNAVAGKEPRSHEDVRRVAVCPGGASTILVTTSTKLLGSPDGDGSTFVPLFTARESAPIGSVACSPTNPNEVIITTGDGTFRSTDGGASFDPMGGAFGVAASSAVAFGPPVEGGKSALFVATGRDLWTGDPGQPDAMHLVPISPETSTIRDVVAARQSLWVTTETGARVSNDGGATWRAVDELEGAEWTTTAVAAAGGGREHVMVLGEDASFERTPGSTAFNASFRAQSRRRLRQVVALPATAGADPGFVLVTNGDLWTTSVVDKNGRVGDEKTRQWAQQRLAHLPSLSGLLDRALVHNRLSSPQVEALADRMKRRGWFPSVVISGAFAVESVSSRRLPSRTNPTEIVSSSSQNTYAANANLVWELPDVVLPAYNFSLARKNLYDLQKQLSFVVEDAYVERWQVLSQLAAGGLDTEQLLSLEARLELLDLVLREFAGDTSLRAE